VFLLEVRGEMLVIPSITAVILHHIAMDKGALYCVVTTE